MKSTLPFLLVALASAPAFAADAYTRADICKAAVAQGMGYSMGRMKISHIGQTPQLFYVRKADHKRLYYRCQFTPDHKVSWAERSGPNQPWGALGKAVVYRQEGTHLWIHADQPKPVVYKQADFRR